METKVMKVDEAGEGVERTGSRKKEERKHGSWRIRSSFTATQRYYGGLYIHDVH